MRIKKVVSLLVLCVLMISALGCSESSSSSGKKSFNAVLLEGDRNSKCAVTRSDSLKGRLKKDGYDINYVFKDTACILLTDF